MSMFRVTTLLFSVSVLMHAGYLEYDDDNGTPYKWSTSSAQDVKIAVDAGDVSGTVDNDAANTVIDTVIDYYNNVTGTELDIVKLGNTSGDITAANRSTYFDFSDSSQITTNNSCKISQDVPGANLVIFFDEDGSFFSSIQGGSSILGIALPSHYQSNGNILCAYVIINGTTITDADKLRYVLAHEFGHALNLVHSQINGDLADTEPEKMPLMYPIIPADEVQALTVPLKLDDRFSLSYLYAEDEIQTNGRVVGHIENRFGEGVLATNVTCRNPAVVEDAVSWVSGADLDGDGAYTCGLLPNGDYEVEVSPIVVAINEWDVNPPFIPTEIYSGQTESFDPNVDDLDDDVSTVTVSGSAVDDIDIILNENGRLRNGETKSGTVSAALSASSPQIPPFEYIMYVPSNASKVTFDLQAEDSDLDIDLLIRCGSAFSLNTLLVGPLFDQLDPATDQTDVASVSLTGNETIELSNSSSPSIQECEYHIVIPNFETQNVGFELTAILEGQAPKVVFDFSSKEKLQDNGETLVAALRMIAKGDRFLINGITFADEGKNGIDDVTLVKLYEDSNDNGRVDEDDQLLAQTTEVDATTFTIEGLNIYLLDDEAQKFLITYELSSSASMPWYVGLAFLTLILGCMISPRYRVTLLVLVVLGANLSCSSSGSSNYQVTITDKNQISGEALGFGDDFSISFDAVGSVQDFFAN
ncbi:MAG: hypothetical protein KDD46_05400 [Bdellovibrionales bacterium]|nr:hypothetical protein [Bdellovibrionales bacterium]